MPPQGHGREGARMSAQRSQPPLYVVPSPFHRSQPSTVPCAQYTVLLTRHSAVYRAATTPHTHSPFPPSSLPTPKRKETAIVTHAARRPQRHPATISSHIVSSHLISSHRIPSQRIPSHPVTSICAQVVGDGRVRGHPGAGDDGAAATGLAPHPPAPQHALCICVSLPQMLAAPSARPHRL